jgi:transposase
MRNKYSQEFRKEALRLCEREGVTSASQKLGITAKTLYAWQRSARLEHGEAPKGLRPGETVEQGYRRLEHENEELRDANYILKKAMGFMVGR